MAVTQTDCPKSVGNRCVIKVFGGTFVLPIGSWTFCKYKGLSHWTEPDLLLFLLTLGNPVIEIHM